MKIINKITKVFIIIVMVFACTEEDNLSFLDRIPAPSNVSAVFNITQNNTGVVSIFPTAEGATFFDIYFGDATAEPETVKQGNSVKHTYLEGTYDVKIIATNLKGDTVETTKQLVVSFKAPENLEVVIENDAAITKQVNISATADFAATYEFYSGEAGVDQPVATANIGDAISYQYAEAGMYSVKVIAKGGAIQTTEYNMDFEVTEILAPLASAATPPNRGPLDVISIYSSVYTDIEADILPDWGQSQFGSSFTEFDLNGDKMLQYINLSYQGIVFDDNKQDVSNMEFLHLDVWTPNISKFKLFLINDDTDKILVESDLTLNEWTSIDIPLSAFTDQGLTLDSLRQFKFESEGPWPIEGTVFVDNIYFWKQPSAPSVLAGKWKVASEAGSLKVGPAARSGEWFSISEAQVAERACYFDDEYVFGTDFSFNNVLGGSTWIEGWQGSNPDACGSPVAPHDGLADATFVHDAVNNKLTITGNGAYLGLAKVNNAGELPNVDVPTSITYDITLSNNDTEMEVVIEAGSGVFWTYKLVKDTNITTTIIDGTWKVASEEGSLKVGPNKGSGEWFSISAAQVAERGCYFDDEYVFKPGGDFSNELGANTWLEAWQTDTADACGLPVAPHDNSVASTFTFDADSNQITLTGKGAYLGLAKVNNAGELSDPANAPDAITYDVTLSNNNTEMIISIEAGAGVFWTYKLVKN